ncbi:lysophosphatidic acid receptor 5b [Scophthalmus maximus]|nr:lysophosphatidic acid receptor 5b [Scophthalmus maximus]
MCTVIVCVRSARRWGCCGSCRCSPSLACTFSAPFSHKPNMSNNTVGENGTAHDMQSTAYALMYGSVMALGLPLNAVSLWILLRRHGITSPSTVFMVNLAISDLLLVISLPARVFFYATGTWPLGSLACVCFTMLFRNNFRSSIIFITFISVDRLLAVVYPLRSRRVRTTANAWRAAVLIWLLLYTVNVPESVKSMRIVNGYNGSLCFEFRRRSGDSHISFLHSFFSVFVLTLLGVNIVCTVLVTWTLRRRVNESAKVDNKVNVMLILAVNLLMFTIFFLPLSLFMFKSAVPYITPMTCFATVNCCLDPLLYYFSFDGFWKRKEDVGT